MESDARERAPLWTALVAKITTLCAGIGLGAYGSIEAAQGLSRSGLERVGWYILTGIAFIAAVIGGIGLCFDAYAQTMRSARLAIREHRETVSYHRDVTEIEKAALDPDTLDGETTNDAAKPPHPGD